MRKVVSSLFLLGVLWTAPARAAEVELSNFEHRPFAVYAQLGLGTPLGWGGVEAEATLFRYLALSGGVGAGFSGPQVAFMPRLRLPFERRAAFTLGAGVSYGRVVMPTECIGFGCAPPSQGDVGWANVEPGFELREAYGASFRLFAGYGRMIGGELTCVQPQATDCDKRDFVVYLGTGLGWAF
jgi:hypothetical protein